MLNWEEAEKRLESFKLKDGYKRRKARINKLPKASKAIGKQLLGKKLNVGWGMLDAILQGDAAAEKRRALFQTLDTLTGEERLNLFAAFFPDFPDVIERAWQDGKRRPYQQGYARKAFRSQRVEDTLETRVDWLAGIIQFSMDYEQPLSWYVVHAPYLGYVVDDAFAPLFAAAINLGDSEVCDALIVSAKGEHEVGRMGRHIPRALMMAEDLDGWTFVEKLLLAAQRQEGLRQIILEAVDEAHPKAFQRMLTLIVKEKLSRFAATIRAVNVWLDMQLDTSKAKQADAVITALARVLDDPSARQKALESKDAEQIYLALWATAFGDAHATISLAKRFFNDPMAEKRYVAVHLLAQLDLDEARVALVPALQDRDLRVALRALDALSHIHHDYRSLGQESSIFLDLFDDLESLASRMPKKQDLEPIVWAWTGRTARKGQVLSLLASFLDKRPVSCLHPHLAEMDSDGRSGVATFIAEQVEKKKRLDTDTREMLLMFVGDKSSYIRQTAVDALKAFTITPEEAEGLEFLLSRKAGDLRRSVINLLLKQKTALALASAERLVHSSKALQREAGLEMLTGLQGDKSVLPTVQSPCQRLSRTCQDQQK